MRITNIEVGISEKVRTEQTADAFIEEIQTLQSLQKGEDLINITKKINKMAFYHSVCKKLLKKQGVKFIKPKAVQDFIDSELMQSLIGRVNNRLGLSATNPLDYTLLQAILRTCRFEFAIYGQSPWCASLSNTEIKIFELLDDVEDYLEDAYGNNLVLIIVICI